MLKIIQSRLQQYVNYELSDVQDKGTRNQIAKIIGEKKKRERELKKKKSTSTLLTMPKPLCGSQQIGENSYRDQEQTTLSIS